MHGLAFALTFWQFVSHDILHPLTGPASAKHGGYLFWSGIAGSFVLGGGIWTGTVVLYRKHNCHIKGCWRIGRHPAAGGKYIVCPKHHPGVPDKHLSVSQVHADHHAWLHDMAHVVHRETPKHE